MSQDVARPFDPTPVAEVDIYEVCRQFVLEYGLPALSPEHVRQGWQNKASLPAGTNEYAIISILSEVRHGTTVETFDAPDPSKDDPGNLSLNALMELLVQIDFCSIDDTARRRAQRLAIVSRSSVGPMFFNDRGMSLLYADDAKDISFVGSENQFVRRYMVTLHATISEGVAVKYDYFDTVKMERVEDVDMHHKP